MPENIAIKTSNQGIESEEDPLSVSNRHRKKFQCPKCRRGYSRFSDMKAHLEFQCGKAPRYQCPYCSKKDKFSSNLYKHVRKIHKDKKLVIIDMHKQVFTPVPKIS